jgi:hypothetical protein
MKSVISVSLAILIAFVSLQKTWILIAFHVNNGYIVQKLCVNRDKPKLKCGGKCQLQKQFEIADNQSSEQNYPNPVSVKKIQEISYFLPIRSLSWSLEDFSLAQICGFYWFSVSPEPVFPVLHPPV